MEKMEKTLIFIDTETSCFANEICANTSIRPFINENGEINYPHISQISWIITARNGNEIITRDFIIKPDGYKITLSATSIHGITNDYANDHGISIKEVIDIFISDIQTYNCYKICGHNVKFDIYMILAELLRLNYIQFFNILSLFHYEDTCVNSKIMHYVNSHDIRGRVKKPKLSELYKKLFGELFENAHNSLSDIFATKKCFFECVKLGLIDQHA